MNWDFLIVLSPFIAVLAFSVWMSWGTSHGQFQLTETDEGWRLEYNSNGKLYDCGMFDTKQAALDKVEFYRMRRADRPVMPTQPI